MLSSNIVDGVFVVWSSRSGRLAKGASSTDAISVVGSRMLAASACGVVWSGAPVMGTGSSEAYPVVWRKIEV